MDPIVEALRSKVYLLEYCNDFKIKFDGFEQKKRDNLIDFVKFCPIFFFPEQDVTHDRHEANYATGEARHLGHRERSESRSEE